VPSRRVRPLRTPALRWLRTMACTGPGAIVPSWQTVLRVLDLRGSERREPRGSSFRVKKGMRLVRRAAVAALAYPRSGQLVGAAGLIAPPREGNRRDAARIAGQRSRGTSSSGNGVRSAEKAWPASIGLEREDGRPRSRWAIRPPGGADITSFAQAYPRNRSAGGPVWRADLAEAASLVQTNSVGVAKQDHKRWSHRRHLV
jgi:hypothetical protein